MPPLPASAQINTGESDRWDGQDLRAFTGTYGGALVHGAVPQGVDAQLLAQGPVRIRRMLAHGSTPISSRARRSAFNP